MEIEDFTPAQIRTQIYMRLLGYDWNHPRVQQFLNRVEQPSRHHLSIHAYRRLAEALEDVWKEELNRPQKAARLYALSQGVKLDSAC